MPPSNDSQDVPLATVAPFGPSELAAFIAILGGLLATFFGDDFGLRAQAQQLAPLAFALASVGLGIARAIKHHGVAHSNAVVLAARPALPADLPADLPIDLSDVEVDGDGEPAEPPFDLPLDADEETSRTVTVHKRR